MTLSNPINQMESTDCQIPDCHAVCLIIEPKEKDIGDFSVRRLLPFVKQRMVGPWLFFDHMGPAEFEAGNGINVRPHPHIHLATVTYLFEGEILHRDSIGSNQTITPGDINLMVAGKGIVHSERERPQVTAQAHRLHGLQLWMALPEDEQEMEPAFYHYASSEIPSITVDECEVRVMMGSAYGVTSPVKTFAQTLYLEANMKAGDTLELPCAEARAVYVADGEVEIDDASIERYHMAVLSSQDSVIVRATHASRIALIGGEEMSPRHMFWNFASTAKERIEQAKQDWQAGRFPKVVGDDEEFMPLP
jgi:hypothetical protein